MIKSNYSQHVYYFPPGSLYYENTLEGGWYFFNEADLLEGGPFLSEKEAINKINEYAQSLNTK